MVPWRREREPPFLLFCVFTPPLPCTAAGFELRKPQNNAPETMFRKLQNFTQGSLSDIPLALMKPTGTRPDRALRELLSSGQIASHLIQ